MEAALEIFIKNYYENARKLLNYFSGAISGIVVRLKNAADNKVFGDIIQHCSYAILFYICRSEKGFLRCNIRKIGCQSLRICYNGGVATFLQQKISKAK